jgi:hemin uptake protein HemP
MVTATRPSGTLRLRTGPASRDARPPVGVPTVQHAATTQAASPRSEREPSAAGTRGNATGTNTQVPLQSDDLLQGRTHVSIVHNGETYQLRATRLGKLILTK